MTQITAGRALVQTLERWGVDHVYGIPADSINNLVEGLWQEREHIRYIQVRHEEGGALAAAADAKYTGKIGVAFASSGPGSVHMLNGLYDAKMDNVPVLALVGQVSTGVINTRFFQELDEIPIFRDVAVDIRQAANAQQIPAIVDGAIRTAYAKHGVAVVILPDDLSGTQIDFTPRKTPTIPAPNLHFDIDEEQLDRAAELIRGAERPVLWIGKGLRGQRETVMRFSEKFHVPVVSTAPATGVVPQTWPNYMGRRGRLGDKPAWEATQLADLLIFAGTDYPFARFMPKNKTIIQVNTDPADIGRQFDADLAFAADAGDFLARLTARGGSSKAEPFEHAAQVNRRNWLHWLDALADDDSKGLAAEAVIREVARHAARNAVFGIDVGNNTAWALRQLPFDHEQRLAMSPWYGTLGFAVPAGIAAALSYPGREVWTISGDGGFAMMNQEILTEVRYKLPVVNIVLENRSFGYIRHEQIQGKLAEYGTDLLGADWAGMARSFGAVGLAATDLTSLRAAFTRIGELKSSGNELPVVLDAKIRNVDPIDTSFIPLDEKTFGAEKAKAYRERYNLDDEPALAELLSQSAR